MATENGLFRRWLKDQFRADPASVGRYAASACRPVRVTRRWWRGQRMMAADAEVKLGTNEVGSQARTQPRWRLIPDAMKAEFTSLEKAVDRLVARYTVNAEDAAPMALGDGVYVIDAAELPEVQRRLSQFQTEWGRAADRWTTEDGYARLHDLLKEQMGERNYEEAKGLVPERHALRTMFGLIVRPLAVRLVPDGDDDPDTRAAVEDNTVSLLATAVTRPREQFAAALDPLVGRLVGEGPGGAPEALKPLRTVKGVAKAVARSVPAEALLAAREAAERFAPLVELTDARLRGAWGAVWAELPPASAPDAVAAVALRLKTEDAAALRLGMILTKAADAARDEAGMCEEFALRRRAKAGPAEGV